MKFSNHTIIISDYPNPGQNLAYNTRSQAMVEISNSYKNFIESFDQQPESVRHEYDETTRGLHQAGILVRNEDEDMLRLKTHLEQIKHGYVKSQFVVTVLTTYACNLKCVYCFQESSRTNEKMTAETSEHVMDWLKEHLVKNDYKELYLNFYGGEPLVNKPTLEKIVKHMREWCHEKGISFKFMIQTNGYLMTPELIDRYKALGLEYVRISVDGVKADHDKNRPLRKGGGTFDVIMKNIVDCAPKIKIGLSVSYDNGDFGPIERLLNYCEEVNILHQLGEFVFSPVFASLGPEGEAEKIQNSSCMCNFENDNLVDANKKIGELMASKGLPQRSGMSTAVCPLTRSHSGGTIDQHGLIYKCNSMLGHPELAIGDVRENEYNKKHEEFVNLDVWKQCPADCTFMPICSGGCRLSSFLTKQNFKTPSCHKPYLYAMAPEFIKRDYERMMARQKQTEQKEAAAL